MTKLKYKTIYKTFIDNKLDSLGNIDKIAKYLCLTYSLSEFNRFALIIKNL